MQARRLPVRPASSEACPEQRRPRRAAAGALARPGHVRPAPSRRLSQARRRVAELRRCRCRPPARPWHRARRRPAARRTRTPTAPAPGAPLERRGGAAHRRRIHASRCAAPGLRRLGVRRRTTISVGTVAATSTAAPRTKASSGRQLDQRSAQAHRDACAGGGGDLLGARDGRTAIVADIVDYESAVQCGQGVQPGVDNGGCEAEREVRAAAAERHREQPRRGDRRPSEHERKAATEPARPAAVRPRPDGERDHEAGDCVDRHDGADQRGRVVDALQEDW